MHAQDQLRSLVDRPLVIGDPSAIRRADFAQRSAALRHYIGDSEAASDLDQLSSRDDYLSAFRQRIQQQQHCRCVVIRDYRSFASRESSQQFLAMCLSMTALANRQIVFEVRVASGGFRDCFDRLSSERRTAEIRMNYDPGSIDDSAKRWLNRCGGA